mmetsp:Transcript_19766/g.58640  ORF Transcript_19766/g.58640 Transcript_19766/m.58640 type:complete len:446 (-) Transcript_19766:1848-3185(-)
MLATVASGQHELGMSLLEAQAALYGCAAAAASTAEYSYGGVVETPLPPVTPLTAVPSSPWPTFEDADESDAQLPIQDVATFMAGSSSAGRYQINTSITRCAEVCVGVAWSQGCRDVMEGAHTVDLAVEAECNMEGRNGAHARQRGGTQLSSNPGALLPAHSIPSRGAPGVDTPSVGAPGVDALRSADTAGDVDGVGDGGAEHAGLVSLFACFDGHGGPEVARFCARNIAPVMCLASAFDDGRGDLSASLTEAFLILDEAVTKHAATSGSGCCATVTLLRGDELAVAGVGDTRAVLCRAGGAAFELTQAHRPTDPAERARIAGAGGTVVSGRVNACLSVSRALGDATFKQSVGLPAVAQQISPEPHVVSVRLAPCDEFLVLACDGVWTAMGPQQVVDFVRGRLARGAEPDAAAAELAAFCLAPLVTRYDSVTVVVVVFSRGGAAVR